jgi:predicted acyltransferase
MESENGLGEFSGIVDVVVEKSQPPGKGRLASLDALRGFDMFWIIGGWWIVQGLDKGLNNAWFKDYVVAQTQHAPWEGFTAWDLIMPLFLFVVGVAMPLSFAKRIERGEGALRVYSHIVFRVIVLWFLGMIAQGRLLEYDLSQMRFYSNTLQAIAIGYLIGSILVLNLSVRWQAIATAALLLLYWALLMLVPVPGFGRGQLTPEGNLAIHLDKLILGPYQDGTTYTWILSSMTFTATVMMGALAGQLLQSDFGKWRKTLFLLAGGVACIYAGWGWGFVFPVIKHIWTSSMVLYAGGWSLILLGVFYLLFDVLPLRVLAYPLIVIGMNAIAVYMATRVYDLRHISDIFVHGLAQWTGPWHDLVRGVGGLLVAWLILFFMYRRRTFIKI